MPGLREVCISVLWFVGYLRVFGWMDDPYQMEEPDEDRLTNTMSLNEARKAYAEGKPIE